MLFLLYGLEGTINFLRDLDYIFLMFDTIISRFFVA